jgi:hypothetical protein
MTNPARTATHRVPFDPTRRNALAAGVLYLVTFVIGIPPAIMLGPVLGDPAYVVGAGADTQVTLASLFDLINALACIGTAVALFPIVKRQSESFALGFVTSRIYEAAVIMIGVVSILAVVTLRQGGTTGTDEHSLVAVGRSLVAVRDWTFILGPGLAPAINALLLGTLMYRSGLVPRVIPTLGLVGAPLLLSSTLGITFGVNEVGTAWTGVATVPIFFWELLLGLWMTFKGFQPSSPLIAAAADPTLALPSTTAPAVVTTKAGAA